MCAFPVEPAGAEHHAGTGQGRSQLHELAADSHGSRNQRLPGGDCAGCERAGERGLGENIFIVRNGVLFTPPLANSALSGITRDSVQTIARHLGLTVTEQRFRASCCISRRGFLYRHGGGGIADSLD